MPPYQNITWGCFGVGWRNKASKVDNFRCEDEWGGHSHRVGSLGISMHLVLHCFLQNKAGHFKVRSLISFGYTVSDQHIPHPTDNAPLYQAELVPVHNVPGSSEFSSKLLFFSDQGTEMLDCFSKLISTLEKKCITCKNF